MIDGNTIKFGYGTIAVCSSCGVLRFIWVEPPQEIGFNINMSELKRKRTISFEYDNDMYKLWRDLTILDELSYIVFFRGYLLNFKNYNAKSVEVIDKAVEKVIEFMLPMFAA